eukprot:COSAG02_NODE_1978_length_10204_cov_8.298268_7_plen_68_part_00
MLNELCCQCILHRWNRLALRFPSMYGTKHFDENFLGKSQIMGNAQYACLSHFRQPVSQYTPIHSRNS